jgi:hypothetical protein
MESRLSIPLKNVTIQGRRDTDVVLTAPVSVFTGEDFNLTAKVMTGSANSVSTASAESPQGRVRFYNGETVLGEAPLINGQAQLGVPFLPTGHASIWAEYFGDATYEPSASTASAVAVGTVATSGNKVVVRDADGQILFTKRPFGAVRRGKIFVDTADMTGDGIADLIVTQTGGNMPVVKTLDGQTGLVLDQFFAGNTRGSRTVVATGHVINQQVTDIVAVNGGRLTVFDSRRGRVARRTLPFGTPKAKMELSLDDVNNNGYDDIILRARLRGRIVTRILDGRTGRRINATV